jgi:hypothetical protein
VTQASPDAVAAHIKAVVQTDKHPPIAIADCGNAEVRPSAKPNSYMVVCGAAQFEMSSRCDATDLSRCLLSIDTWTMTDQALEAKRKLAETTYDSYALRGPRCDGAIALPTATPSQYILNCSDGYVRIEVTCKNADISSCRGVVMEQEQLPYGLPPN